MTIRTVTLALAASGAVLLAGCSVEDGDEVAAAETEETSQSLASMLAAKEGLQTTATAMRNTGLIQVFDEAAYYTLLAPSDAAFAAYATPQDEVADEEQRAALAAVLRDHILPGYLTTDDIQSAIAAAGSDSVRIQTMGDHALTFAREGDSIRVTSEDGATGLLLPGEGRANNGVVIPVDAVLKQL